MLNSLVPTIDRNGRKHTVKLNDVFLKPRKFESLGMDDILRGIMKGRASEVDIEVTSAVRNFLMTSPKKERFDLAALNIQRGRDHGVPGCNAMRKSMGLKPFSSFYDITEDDDLAGRLAYAYYDRIDDVDSWVCGVAEDHSNGSSLGPVFDQIIR